MKTKITCASFIATLFFLIPAYCQPPVKQWDARFGGNIVDYFRSLQQTVDGGYILGGHSCSGISGDKTQDNQGECDYWIVKTNEEGLKQWDVRFGGSKADLLKSIRQTTDDGYILGGSSYSGISGDKSQVSQGEYDYWIVKTDANGIKQWDARFGGSGSDQLSSVQQTTDGGYILGGWSLSGISGDKSQSSQGWYDYWVVKVDANGTKQWDKRFGGSEEDQLVSLQQTADGGYIFGGWSISGISGDKTQASQGLKDYWIIKTDANGLMQWDARFGGTDEDVFNSLQQTTDNGYILGGQSNSPAGGDKSQNGQGSSDYWIIKTDANGVKQWDARFGGDSGDFLPHLQQTTDGGYILGGESYSGVGGDKTQGSQGSGDYWIVKTDANGIKQWDARFGGKKEDKLESLDQTTEGGFILGGVSYSGIGADKTQPSQGERDYWIVKTTAGGAPICNAPTSLSAVNIASTTAELQWSEVSGAIGYKVTYKAVGTSQLNTISSVNNHKTITGLTPNTTYVWKVKSICSKLPLITSEGSEQANFTTSPFRLAVLPETKVEIHPNPVSQSATVSFSLNEESPVEMEIIDVKGRLLKEIANQNFPTGNHEVTFIREALAAGIYFLQMQTNDGIIIMKIVMD